MINVDSKLKGISNMFGYTLGKTKNKHLNRRWKMKKVFIKLVMSVFVFSLIVSFPAGATDVKIGAMRLGTSWYVFGATLAKLLQDALPAGSNVEVVARGG